jgi:hypothetical protein
MRRASETHHGDAGPAATRRGVTRPKRRRWSQSDATTGERIGALRTAASVTGALRQVLGGGDISALGHLLISDVHRDRSRQHQSTEPLHPARLRGPRGAGAMGRRAIATELVVHAAATLVGRRGEGADGRCSARSGPDGENEISGREIRRSDRRFGALTWDRADEASQATTLAWRPAPLRGFGRRGRYALVRTGVTRSFS